jgi:hypothetical protein
VDGATVTSTNLNALVTDASFTSSAVDNSTTQLSGTAIVVRDNGIDKDKLDTSIKGVLELVGTAYLGADKTGNTRGTGALDVQSSRSLDTQVASAQESVTIGVNNTAGAGYASAIGHSNTASGGVASSAIGYNNSATGQLNVAIGSENTSSGQYSLASGKSNTSSGYNSSAFGSFNTASNYDSSAFGQGNTASGGNSSAFGSNNSASAYNAGAFGRSNLATQAYALAVGYSNTASGVYSSAIGQETTASGYATQVFGKNAKSTVDDTTEIGNWSSSTVRAGALRLHSDGQHSVTIRDSASAPTDGGATAGSEANGTLARGMFTIQKNGNVLTLYYNDGGTIKSLPVGTLS